MWGFLLGGAIGYLFGARAGRERYDQILHTYRRIMDHPAVQGAAGVASAKLTEVTGGLVKNGRPRSRRA